MATTDVMGREDIGGLVRRHFLKMVGVATSLVVGGVAAAVFLSDDTPDRHGNPAGPVMAVEQSEELRTPYGIAEQVLLLNKQSIPSTSLEERSNNYKRAANKYQKQVEMGRNHVAEKYNVPLAEVIPVVLDEVSTQTEHSTKPSHYLFAMYSHPKGFLGLSINPDNTITREHPLEYCSPEQKAVAESFLKQLGEYVGVRGMRKLSKKDLHSGFELWKQPRGDEIYHITAMFGWSEHLFYDEKAESYIYDASAKQIIGKPEHSFIFGGTFCE